MSPHRVAATLSPCGTEMESAAPWLGLRPVVWNQSGLCCTADPPAGGPPPPIALPFPHGPSSWLQQRGENEKQPSETPGSLARLFGGTQRRSAKNSKYTQTRRLGQRTPAADRSLFITSSCLDMPLPEWGPITPLHGHAHESPPSQVYRKIAPQKPAPPEGLFRQAECRIAGPANLIAVCEEASRPRAAPAQDTASAVTTWGSQPEQRVCVSRTAGRVRPQGPGGYPLPA